VASNVTLSDIEQAMLGRLVPLGILHDVAIGLLDAEHLERPVIERQVFVSYRGSNFGDQLTMNGTNQRREIEFEVISRFQDLRIHNEAYPLLVAIRKALTGFKPVPQALLPLRQINERFNDRFLEAGIWAYTQLFKLTVINFEE